MLNHPLPPSSAELGPALSATGAAATAEESDTSDDDEEEDDVDEADDYDLALSQLLADVDLESLEQFVGELLPQVQKDEKEEEVVEEEGERTGPAANADGEATPSKVAASGLQQQETTEDKSNPGSLDNNAQHQQHVREEDTTGQVEYDDFLYTGPSV